MAGAGNRVMGVVSWVVSIAKVVGGAAVLGDDGILVFGAR